MFKLSRVLGGRNEVLELPAAEAFKFMDMTIEKEYETAEREREKYWLNYLSMMFSQVPQLGEKPEFTQAREKFTSLLQPQGAKPAPKRHEWNIPKEVLEEYENKKPLTLVKGEAEKGGN